jgi:hypothetical protein
MTSDDEPAEGGGSESAGSSSLDAFGPRFGELLERLGNREESADRPPEDQEQRDPDRNPTGTETDTEITATETDADGWMWGTSRRSGTDHASDSGTPDSDQRAEAQPMQSAESGDRIWNADAGEAFDTIVSGDAQWDDLSSDSGDTTASESPDHDESPVIDEPEDAREGTTGSLESPEDSRWTDLEASLGVTDAADQRPTTDETVETHDDDGQRIDTDADESWDALDAKTGSSDASSGELSILDETRSAELDRVTNAASVLALGPTDHPLADAICSRFLVGEDGPRDVLFVTFDASPSDRIEICHRTDEWTGGNIGIVEVGHGQRNAAASETTLGAGTGSITVRHVSKPNDLSKLGIVISQLLTELSKTPRQTVLCFHTLSALHNQVGTKTLFRFLNTLQGRLSSVDAVGHYHMNPELHDELVVETLRPIFDSIIRYSTEGDLDIE